MVRPLNFNRIGIRMLSANPNRAVLNRTTVTPCHQFIFLTIIFISSTRRHRWIKVCTPKGKGNRLIKKKEKREFIIPIATTYLKGG